MRFADFGNIFGRTGRREGQHPRGGRLLFCWPRVSRFFLVRGSSAACRQFCFLCHDKLAALARARATDYLSCMSDAARTLLLVCYGMCNPGRLYRTHGYQLGYRVSGQQSLCMRRLAPAGLRRARRTSDGVERLGPGLTGMLRTRSGKSPRRAGTISRLRHFRRNWQ